MQQLLHQNTMVMQMLNPLACGASLPSSMLPFAMASPTGTQLQVPALSSMLPSYYNIVRLPRLISLMEFCLRYNISNSDLQKLESLEVHLGDHAVEKLEPEYWKEAGFLRLGWGCFVHAHKQFLTDITNGVWD
jgi:hypothetical protein